MTATQDGNLGLYNYWDLGEAFKTGMESNLALLGATVLLNVKSATTTAEPGSPANGDRYLVPPSATGTNWTGQDEKLAVYEVDTWAFYTPKELWFCRAEDTKQMHIFTSSAWVLEGSLYGQYADDSAAATGGVPVDGVYVNSSTGALHIRLT